MKQELSDSNVLHKPVLLKEVLSFWHGKEGGFYIDATAGTGGHTEGLLEKDKNARCLAIDCDARAVEVAQKRLEKFGKRVTLLKGSYMDLNSIMKENDCPESDGLLADLGYSSLQVDDPQRGFSFQQAGPLDMRMDRAKGETAAGLIQRLPVDELADIIHRYGNEPSARRIAAALKEAALRHNLNNTLQCAELVSRIVLSKKGGERTRIHPATKTFQALRIAVNEELSHLKGLLELVPSLLSSGGRALFISFHSLEDKMVKEKMREWSGKCVCPPNFPQCVCGRKPIFKTVTPKAVMPAAHELETNPRSRSARIRVSEKV